MTEKNTHLSYKLECNGWIASGTIINKKIRLFDRLEMVLDSLLKAPENKTVVNEQFGGAKDPEKACFSMYLRPEEKTE